MIWLGSITMNNSDSSELFLSFILFQTLFLCVWFFCRELWFDIQLAIRMEPLRQSHNDIIGAIWNDLVGWSDPCPPISVSLCACFAKWFSGFPPSGCSNPASLTSHVLCGSPWFASNCAGTRPDAPSSMEWWCQTAAVHPSLGWRGIKPRESHLERRALLHAYLRLCTGRDKMLLDRGSLVLGSLLLSLLCLGRKQWKHTEWSILSRHTQPPTRSVYQSAESYPKFLEHSNETSL